MCALHDTHRNCIVVVEIVRTPRLHRVNTGVKHMFVQVSNDSKRTSVMIVVFGEIAHIARILLEEVLRLRKLDRLIIVFCNSIDSARFVGMNARALVSDSLC